MKQDFKCYLGLHKYEVLKEENVVDARGNQMGIAIISRCSNCGKLKVKYVNTVVNDRL